MSVSKNNSNHFLIIFNIIIRINFDQKQSIKFPHSALNRISIFIFRAVANFTKSLDPNRPITAAIAVSVNEDKAVSDEIQTFWKCF